MSQGSILVHRLRHLSHRLDLISFADDASPHHTFNKNGSFEKQDQMSPMFRVPHLEISSPTLFMLL